MTDKPEKPYREGCDDSAPQPEEKPPVTPRLVSEEEMAAEESDELKESGPETDEQEENPKPPEGEPEVVPDTAFLVVRHVDGRVEATTTLPGFTMARQAGLRDLRDISHALFLDVSTTIQGRVSATEASNALQQAMVKQQIAKMTQGLKKQ